MRALALRFGTTSVADERDTIQVRVLLARPDPEP